MNHQFSVKFMLGKKVEKCLIHLSISPVTAAYLRTPCSLHVVASKPRPKGKWIIKLFIGKTYHLEGS